MMDAIEQLRTDLFPRHHAAYQHAHESPVCDDEQCPLRTLHEMVQGFERTCLQINWLRVSDTTERSQVDQRIGHQLHAIVPLLDTFKSEQQPLEFVLPRKGPLDTHPQGMDGGVEQPLAPALGVLAVARVLFDVGDQASIKNTLPIVGGIGIVNLLTILPEP